LTVPGAVQSSLASQPDTKCELTEPAPDRSVGSHPRRAAARVLLMGLAVAVPLVSDPRPGAARSLPRMVLLVAGAVVAGALARPRLTRLHALHWAVLGWLGWVAISAAAAPDRELAVLGLRGSYDGLLSAAAFALVFLAATAAFRARDVERLLSALWFGAGGPVLLYGLAQLVDRLTSPAPPRPPWGGLYPATWTISSTLGNPNILAGLLAMLVPIGAVLFLLTTSRRRRTLIAGMALLLAVELIVTTGRGGLLGAVTAVVVLAALLRPQLRPHRRLLLIGLAAVLTLGLAVAVATSAAGVSKTSVASIGRTGPGSTIDLRLELWKTAWRMAEDHPILGVGPDHFARFFPDYESDRFVWLYGAFTLATSAHNIFLNTWATVGTPGLLALLAVLIIVGRRVRRSWPRSHGPRDSPADRRRRLVLAATTAALAAFVVQASFGTSHLALSLWFWTLLGATSVLTEPS
jgi:O-antigen ligase